MSSFDAQDWSAFLSEELGLPVQVTFGRARRRVLHADQNEHGVRVRMNAGFAAAPPDVRLACAQWLRSGRRARKASARLDEWIAELAKGFAANPSPRRNVKLEPQGEVYDLEELLRELVPDELPELQDPQRRPDLTWGRRGPRRARRSLQLGSFSPELRIVRLHPVLDRVSVPRFFVRYVLFHELLHAVLERGERSPGGRVLHHGPAFRQRERSYPDYVRAVHWQEKNLGRLLRAARSLAPATEKPARTPRRVGVPAESAGEKDRRPDRPILQAIQGWLFPPA